MVQQYRQPQERYQFIGTIQREEDKVDRNGGPYKRFGMIALDGSGTRWFSAYPKVNRIMLAQPGSTWDCQYTRWTAPSGSPTVDTIQEANIYGQQVQAPAPAADPVQPPLQAPAPVPAPVQAPAPAPVQAPAPAPVIDENQLRIMRQSTLNYAAILTAPMVLQYATPDEMIDRTVAVARALLQYVITGEDPDSISTFLQEVI